MKPQSKCISLTLMLSNHEEITFVALCEDGSVWYFYPTLEERQRWELISEMENGRYI